MMKIDLTRYDMRKLHVVVSEGFIGGACITVQMNVKDVEWFNAKSGMREPLTQQELNDRKKTCDCDACRGEEGQHNVFGHYFVPETDLYMFMHKHGVTREQAIKAEVRKCIITTLTHEVDECLYIDGVQFTDPHPEITEQKRKDFELQLAATQAAQRLADRQGRGDESWFLDPETKQRPAGQTPTQPQVITPDMTPATK